MTRLSMAPTWGPFNWTTGEAIWAALIFAAIVVELLGLFRVGPFEPLTWSVEHNIRERVWVSVGLGIFFIWLQIHWWTNWFPWER